MSDGTAAPRSLQVDDLLTAINRNSIAVTALAAAIGACVIALERNTSKMDEMLEEDDEFDEHDEGCDDNDCAGECLDEPPPKKRRATRRK